jgi:hypothetical protein
VATDEGAVDAPERVIELAPGVELALERREQPVPEPRAAPASEAAVDGLPRPIALGQIAPRHAGVQPEQHAVEDAAVILIGATPGGHGGQQRRQPGPLGLGEFMTTHDGRHTTLPRQSTLATLAEVRDLSNTA